jgi:hypothetical protein
MNCSNRVETQLEALNEELRKIFPEIEDLQLRNIMALSDLEKSFELPTFPDSSRMSETWARVGGLKDGRLRELWVYAGMGVFVVYASDLEHGHALELLKKICTASLFIEAARRET